VVASTGAATAVQAASSKARWRQLVALLLLVLEALDLADVAVAARLSLYL
jgi:hypothetical protein